MISILATACGDKSPVQSRHMNVLLFMVGMNLFQCTPQSCILSYSSLFISPVYILYSLYINLKMDTKESLPSI